MSPVVASHSGIALSTMLVPQGSLTLWQLCKQMARLCTLSAEAFARFAATTTWRACDSALTCVSRRWCCTPQVIEPIADLLSIPRDNVFANRILFNNDGSYQNFDEAEPTSQAGGKAEVIKQCVTPLLACGVCLGAHCVCGAPHLSVSTSTIHQLESQTRAYRRSHGRGWCHRPGDEGRRRGRRVCGIWWRR